MPAAGADSPTKRVTIFSGRNCARTCGNYDECGILHRRHVQVLAIQLIGKEADNLEEREVIGEDDDVVEYDFSTRDRAKLRSAVLADQKKYGISVREVCDLAGISHHTMAALRRRGRLPSTTLLAITGALGQLTAERRIAEAQQGDADAALMRKREELESDAALATFLGISRSYVTRLLDKSRSLTVALRTKLAKADGSESSDKP